jgi:hypothetical protein
MRRMASFASTAVKGTLIESDAGWCLAHMFRYPSNTHRTIGDFDAVRNKVFTTDLSIVFAIPGKYVFRTDLGDSIHTPHRQLMYWMSAS